MNTIISSKLKEIENNYNIKIIFASVVGSQDLGYANQYSDVDINFVYLKNSYNKKSIFEYSNYDNILLKNDDYEFNGLDITKFLKLHYQSNIMAYDMINSNNIIIGDNLFEDLPLFNLGAMRNVYKSIVKNIYKRYFKGNNIRNNFRFKKFLMMVRFFISFHNCNNNIPPKNNYMELIHYSGLPDDIKQHIYLLFEYYKIYPNPVYDENIIEPILNYISNDNLKKKKISIPNHKSKIIYDNKFNELKKVRMDYVL